MSTAIVWFRSDLRLADNPALYHARSQHDRVVPVYIWDPEAEGAWPPGGASRWWLHHSLVELDDRLRQRDSRLIVASGDTLGELMRIRSAVGAGAVYWNRRYEPAIVRRDKALMRELADSGMEVGSFNSSLLFEPWERVKDDGRPYRVFTPFWKSIQRHWHLASPWPEPRQLAAPGRWPASLKVSDLRLNSGPDWAVGLRQRWVPGELGARRRLDAFIEQAVADYAEDRDRPDRDSTSRLSPHLHFGETSPAQIARALDAAGCLPGGRGKFTFLSEIAWREFAWHLLWHFPDTPEKPLQTNFCNFPWRNADDYASDLEAWQKGRTGIPMVDAGMRELWHTGWMHNRVRMVVASFLTKNLLIPWQEGARWFWDTLVDADLANNTQGWQWTTGCGADAAPYFRVFNPVLQGQKFDSSGDYVSRWCPELAERPTRHLHQPVDESDSEHYGYPAACVDLKGSRQRALAAWERIRK